MHQSSASSVEAKKILLVDDDSVVRGLRARILGNLGHNITEADSLSTARSLWVPGAFNLVIVDVKHSLRDAIDFCEEVKRAANQMVALLTPYTAYVPKDSCPDDVIHKEDGPANFVREVQQLLGVA
jgi:CheY-like chemotaxis protein